MWVMHRAKAEGLNSVVEAIILPGMIKTIFYLLTSRKLPVLPEILQYPFTIGNGLLIPSCIQKGINKPKCIVIIG
jgi:hypothetical protein